MNIFTCFLILPAYSFQVTDFNFPYSSKVTMEQNSDIFAEFELTRPGSFLIQCASECAKVAICYGVELCDTSPKRCRLWGAEFTNSGGDVSFNQCSRYTKEIGNVNGCSDSCDCDSTGLQSLTLDGKSMEVKKCFRGNHMWTVIQRRFNGSVSFNRDWMTYKNGFGSLDSEFWLGNENIHLLTKNGLTYLRIDLMKNNGEWKYAEFSSFSLDTEGNMYRLSVFGYTGDAGDMMGFHHGMSFSTPEVDNDAASNFDCASYLQSGWWYRDCNKCDLNGKYGYGVHWSTLTGSTSSLKETRMMIREP